MASTPPTPQLLCCWVADTHYLHPQLFSHLLLCSDIIQVWCIVNYYDCYDYIIQMKSDLELFHNCILGQSCVTQPAFNIVSGCTSTWMTCLHYKPQELGSDQPPLDQQTPSRLPNYVLTGFTFGFRIGDNHKAVHFRASGHNLQSVRENPQLVEQYIQEEVRSWSSYLLDPILLFLYNTSSFLNLVTGKSLQIYQSLLVQGFMLPSIPACYPFAMPSLDDWTLIMQKLGKYP